MRNHVHQMNFNLHKTFLQKSKHQNIDRHLSQKPYSSKINRHPSQEVFLQISTEIHLKRSGMSDQQTPPSPQETIYIPLETTPPNPMEPPTDVMSSIPTLVPLLPMVEGPAGIIRRRIVASIVREEAPNFVVGPNTPIEIIRNDATAFVVNLPQVSNSELSALTVPDSDCPICLMPYRITQTPTTTEAVAETPSDEGQESREEAEESAETPPASIVDAAAPDPTTNGEIAVILECRHVIGDQCLLTWLIEQRLGRGASCPQCRRRVRVPLGAVRDQAVRVLVRRLNAELVRHLNAEAFGGQLQNDLSWRFDDPMGDL